MHVVTLAVASRPGGSAIRTFPSLDPTKTVPPTTAGVVDTQSPVANAQSFSPVAASSAYTWYAPHKRRTLQYPFIHTPPLLEFLSLCHTDRNPGGVTGA